MTVEITDANFQEVVINAGKPAVVDFWAEWCGPCRMLTPIIKELSTEYEGRVVVGKVDVDSNPGISAKYGIRNIPTVTKNLTDIEEWGNLYQIDLIARQVVEGFITGLHRSPYHGFSVEFAEHRHYNPGESTRHIDWKLYGRTDKFFIKRYEEETNLRAQFIIDTSSSMLFPNPEKKAISKLFFSVYTSAAMMRLLRRQRDAVGLTLFSSEIEVTTPSKVSEVHSQNLFAEMSRLLERTGPGQVRENLNRPTRASEVMHQLAEMYPKRSLVLLFTDMLDDGDPEELFSALRHFRYNKHEVILFHVKDHKLEEAFDFQNRPHRFVDMETGRSVLINPAEIRTRYRERISEYFNDIKLRCGQFDIDFVEADIRQDFREVLLPLLIKRQKLF
jgi:thioredoxin